MSDHRAISPDESLRRFMKVVAEEAEMNSSFRNRLVLAIGAPVYFEGQDDLISVSPTELIQRYDQDTFTRIYANLKGPSLQKILLGNNLATKDEFKFPKGTKAAEKVDALVEMLLERTLNRARERGML